MIDASWPSLVPMATILVGSVSWVTVTRFRIGPIFSPFSLTLLVLVSIFGFRPLFMLADNNFAFYGYNIRPGFQEATLVGFLSVLSLVLGYAFSTSTQRHRREDRELRETKSAWVAEMDLRRGLITAILLLLSWLTIILALGGGPSILTLLFAGRSEEASRFMSGLPVLIPALPVAAAAALSVGRVYEERRHLLGRRQAWLYWGVTALCIVPPSALGTRRFLLSAVLVAVLAASIPRWNRRLSWRIFAFIVASFLVLAVFPFVRSAGSRRGGRTDLLGAMFQYFSSSGIIETARNFIVSYDTEMFNYVAFIAPRIGRTFPYGYGRGTIGDALLAPLPAAWTPVDRWSDRILQSAFGTNCGQGVCPVPSASGVLYYDLGLLGVVVGFFAIGTLYTRFGSWIFQRDGWGLNATLVFGAFIPVLVRGNTVAIGWIMVNVIILSFVSLQFVNAVCRRPGHQVSMRERSPRPGAVSGTSSRPAQGVR